MKRRPLRRRWRCPASAECVTETLSSACDREDVWFAAVGSTVRSRFPCCSSDITCTHATTHSELYIHRKIAVMLLMHQFHFIAMLLTIQITKTYSTTCKDRAAMQKKFSLASFRNNTGHWIAQVTMLQDTRGTENNFKEKRSPWNIDINFERERCDGVEFQKIEALVTVPPLKPGPDYQFYADMGYYKFHPELTTWQEARDICNSEGAHLAIVNSHAESDLFKQMLNVQRSPGKYAFIGFHDLNVEGQYVTLFGEPLNTTGFMEFAKGEPDNRKYGDDDAGEDCGGFHRDGKLGDLLCTLKSPFICEQEF